MIVELAGPPGAGKTTMLPVALQTLRARGLSPYTVVEAARPFTRRTLAGRLLHRFAPASVRDALMWRLFLLYSFAHRLRFIARHPALIWNVLRWQRQRPVAARARQRKVTFWLFRLMGYLTFLHSHLRDDEILLLDEGFLHRVVQLFASDAETPHASRIRRYVNAIPTPDLLIFVHATPHTCHERIVARGLWQTFEGKQDEEVARFVQNAHRASMIALKFGRARGWSVIELDNDRPTPAQAHAALQRALDHFLDDHFVHEGALGLA